MFTDENVNTANIGQKGGQMHQKAGQLSKDKPIDKNLKRDENLVKEDDNLVSGDAPLTEQAGQVLQDGWEKTKEVSQQVFEKAKDTAGWVGEKIQENLGMDVTNDQSESKSFDKDSLSKGDINTKKPLQKNNIQSDDKSFGMKVQEGAKQVVDKTKENAQWAGEKIEENLGVDLGMSKTSDFKDDKTSKKPLQKNMKSDVKGNDKSFGLQAQEGAKQVVDKTKENAQWAGEKIEENLGVDMGMSKTSQSKGDTNLKKPLQKNMKSDDKSFGMKAQEGAKQVVDKTKENAQWAGEKIEENLGVDMGMDKSNLTKDTQSFAAKKKTINKPLENKNVLGEKKDFGAKKNIQKDKPLESKNIQNKDFKSNINKSNIDNKGFKSDVKGDFKTDFKSDFKSDMKQDFKGESLGMPKNMEVDKNKVIDKSNLQPGDDTKECAMDDCKGDCHEGCGQDYSDDALDSCAHLLGSQI
jgi:hypothetical protein